ncbi:MAG TPA: zf-HC2 domain-containing protein [Gemmatimonadales bacterium]|nr:zf-HC2 domain-containing protein [Gemmatimonadales bacterium]
MSDCQSVIRQLWEYLDGELPAGEAEEIREHLAACAHCYPQYEFQLRFLDALVKAYAAREVPHPEFVRRLRTTLDAIGDDLT